MHKSILVLVFLSALSTAAFSQASIDSELMNLEKAAWNAFGKGDSKYFANLLTTDAVIFNGLAFVDKATAVAGIAARPCEFKSYSFSGFKVTRLDPTTALATYIAEQEKTCGGQKQPSKMAVTTLYVNRKGKWRAAFHQESSLEAGEVILSLLGT
jgi:hypothetical protein